MPKRWAGVETNGTEARIKRRDVRALRNDTRSAATSAPGSGFDKRTVKRYGKVLEHLGGFGGEDARAEQYCMATRAQTRQQAIYGALGISNRPVTTKKTIA
jgi:hypothetical protein